MIANEGTRLPSSSDDALASDDPSYIPALTGLRGIGISLVIIYHCFGILALPNSRLDDVVLRFAEVGWAGVDLFFVLSGFLITRILLDARSSPRYFSAFYARRFLRIFPLYYSFLAVMIFILPLIPWFGRDHNVRALQNGQVWFWMYLFNIRDSLQPLGDFGIANVHLWSLAVEEQFYLVWPAVVLFCRPSWLMRVCVGCVVFAFLLRCCLVAFNIPGTTFVAPSMLTPARIDTFAIGGIIAILSRDAYGRARLLGHLPWVAALAGLALMCVVLPHGRGLHPFNRYTLTVGLSALAALFGCAVAYCATVRTGHAIRLLQSAPLDVLGRYSYAMYVVHYPLLFFLLRRYGSTGVFRVVWGSSLPDRVAFTFVVASLSLVLAYASGQLLEKPALRLKKYFPYK